MCATSWHWYKGFFQLLLFEGSEGLSKQRLAPPVAALIFVGLFLPVSAKKGMSLYENLPIVMGYVIGAYLVFGKAMICAARGWCRCDGTTVEGGASMGLGRAGRGRAVC